MEDKGLPARTLRGLGSTVVVPGAKHGMGRWRYNNPATAKRISTVVVGGYVINILAIVASSALGQGRLAILLTLPLIISPGAALFVYWTGPRSGWRGAWMIRLPVRLEELLPRLEAALRSVGFNVRKDEPGQKPAWLRNSRVVLELNGGPRVWLMPGVPGSKAGLNPRLQPLTTVVLVDGAALASAELERLRSVLSLASGAVALA